ncbi:MAG: type V CRISPR-associated endonuclease Cas1 [Bacilli bacterium]
MITLPAFMYNKVLIVFPMQGDRISFSNDNIIIKDKEDKIKFQYSCYKLFIIYIVGGYTITSGLIEKAKKFGFSIVFLTTNFKISFSINFKTEGNFLLREKQYKCEIKNQIANRIVYNKILNEIECLKKLRDTTNNEGINILKENLEKLNNFDLTINEIMGIEGICAKVYFNRIFKNIPWQSREPRLKNDIPNLLLDIGYTILFNYIEALLNIYGFDLYKANLHQEFYKRKSLVCDIIEPFRVIIDYKVLKMYNLGQIKETDYVIINNKYNLNYQNSQAIILELLHEINEYKVCIFKYIQEYYRWFMKNKDIKEIPIAKVVKNDTY